MIKKEDYRIPESVFNDEKIHMHLLRTRFFEIKGHQLITKRQYNINGELYEVNSVFDLDSRRSTDDNLAALMKKDYEKSLDIQNG